MKNLQYLIAKGNEVSIVLFFAFVLSGLTCPAQAPTQVFARLTMLKVAEGNQREFEKFVNETVKPIQNLRRQKGKIFQWILFKVHFAGADDEYNYVGVGYYPGWGNTEEGPLLDFLKEVDANADPVATGKRQRELRTVVRESIFLQTEAIEPNPPLPSRYVRLDYMKVKPGKNADYLQLERDHWKPFHQRLISENQSSGWGLWQVVFPGGTDLPYDYVVSNRFGTYEQVLAMDYENAFRKANGPKATDVLMRTTDSRNIVRSELWEVISILD